MGKIGVGIVTCGREDNFKKLIDSLKSCSGVIHSLFIFEDTMEDRKSLNSEAYIQPILKDSGLPWKVSGSLVNVGVGKAKNSCLKNLLDDCCDHIFLIEDDIYIKDSTVFANYIKASNETGIQHFNYSQHGMMNKQWPEGIPNPVTIIDYGDVKIPLYRHCVGAFSYYTRECLMETGLLDEDYYNACEHVDHTYEIIKAGMHPPFWFFADIENSWKYLGDEEWSLTQSTISSNPKHKEIISNADAVFVKKHGHYPGQTPLTDEEGVIKSIQEIRKTYVAH